MATPDDDPDITRKVTASASAAAGAGARADLEPVPWPYAPVGPDAAPARPSLAARLDALRAARAPYPGGDVARLCQAATQLLGRPADAPLHGAELVAVLAVAARLLATAGAAVAPAYRAADAATPGRVAFLADAAAEAAADVAALEGGVAGDLGWLAPGEDDAP